MWIIAIGIALRALALAAVIRAWLVHRIRAAERTALRQLGPTRTTHGRALVLYREGFTDVTWCAILRGAGAAVIASHAFSTGAAERSVTNWVTTVVRPHPDPAPKRAWTSTVERHPAVSPSF